MLRSSNPILSKQDAFTPAAPQQGYGQAGASPEPQGYHGYGSGVQRRQAPEGRMTFDDVITKIGDHDRPGHRGCRVDVFGFLTDVIPGAALLPMLVVSGLVGFVVVLLVAFRRRSRRPWCWSTPRSRASSSA